MAAGFLAALASGDSGVFTAMDDADRPPPKRR